MIYINRYKYILIILIFITTILLLLPKEENIKTSKLNGTIIGNSSNKLTVKDQNNLIYTFNISQNDYKIGDNIIIEYTGILNKNLEKQETTLINIIPVSQDEEQIEVRESDSLFSKFNTLANKKVSEMTLDEKIGQVLLVSYPEEKEVDEAINTYFVGGFIFFENDFKDKTTIDVQNMLKNAQNKAKIPLLTAVDEEGGDVIRISSNKNLVSEEFLSPRDLYLEGGFELIKEDTIRKSNLLEQLGLNINLAPVVDISTNSTDYIYNRTIGEPQELTSKYAETVINSSKENKSVSYVLKHFPGYGDNEDTHQGIVIDEREYTTIYNNDLKPFEAGIKSNAEAILVSHNIVKSIDEENPASLSPSIHNLLRNDLDFTGIIMTDDLSMNALSNIENKTVKALLAGNDIIITTNYKESFNELKKALEEQIITEEYLNDTVQKIIAWKYYKGLMYNNGK